MHNLKLTIEYDGGNYHGWQKQKNAGTVQETIENALAVMTREQLRLIGSGRTDAGVHALGQTANFRCSTEIPPRAFVAGLNSLLPDDIVIHSCESVDMRFHSRYDALAKTYQYRILNRPVPSAICRQYAWFIPKELDVRAMQQACGHLLGTRDFKSFEASGSPRSHSVRTVTTARVYKDAADHIFFEITANGFLRFMVRNIVGTLADVGAGKNDPDDFRPILKAENRDHAGATAPPHGLFMVRALYDDTVDVPLSR
ncbi:MAG: tRNA pseudouridine(38-40) synthase TruA [Desulfosalsimonadaceae bacterium]